MGRCRVVGESKRSYRAPRQMFPCRLVPGTARGIHYPIQHHATPAPLPREPTASGRPPRPAQQPREEPLKTVSVLAAGLLAWAPALAAQTTPVEGLRDNTPAVHAFTGARIVVAPGRVLENATLVVRDGRVESVGPRVTPPADARVWPMEGRTIYPGFIDAHSPIGMPAKPPADEGGARHWNPQVRAHVDAAAVLAADDPRAAELRAQGFTVANAVPRLGMFRGRTAVVSLGAGPVADRVVRSGVAHSLTLTRDRELGQGYPTSSMGAIAFIRQTFHDADWHRRAHDAYARDPRGAPRPEANAALAALAGAVQGREPVVVETTGEEELLRALRFADEFPLALWIRGSGSEYRLLDAVRGRRVPLVLPLAYPDTPNVRLPEDALNVGLGALRHWYLAPENPARLAAAGVEFALTADGLARHRDFLPNLRRAVERGLAPETALAALTTVPARYLGISGTHGTLEPGRAANLVVVDGDLFAEGAAIRDVWVDGRRFEVERGPGVEPRGEWRVTASEGVALEGRLELGGTPARPTGTLHTGAGEIRLSSASLAAEPRRLTLAFPGSALGHEGTVRLSATVSGDALHGWGELPDGTRFAWSGERTAPFAGGGRGEGERAAPAPRLALADVRPAMEFGREAIPAQPRDLLVRNATVWTMGPQGTLENADLLVRQGRVVRVGQGLQAPAGAVVVDATGRHVTPGLIDAHLHSGVGGAVNETGSAIVPEVRTGDVLTTDNIWMYRQLAGGLTAAHVMHGSANPIGGQNVFVKMRWGALPDGLLLEGAPRTVKFALGENPKRREDRYPDTRMGTEQIIRDHFLAAREYEAAWRGWERGGRRGVPPRRDLRLEAVAEILNGGIEVQSHAYRQDEMLMLMRLAEEFGFRVRAFHHAVEAYKVAPEIARHGAGAVVWTDWSSFKIEAYDATVYNARLLMDAGVLTTLHSDNSQIASRMNWEAAKMLRTGIGERDALALVTINTARVLGIDGRVGSLEPGKDADFVIWSAHPLSTATRAEQTWVDGRRYFDVEEDRALRAAAERDRARIIQHILNGR
jgi:imidazolonepropionase-like amidohydrolase